MRVHHEALPSPEVIAPITGWHFGDFLPVEMILKYTTEDPLAVELTFPLQPGVSEEVDWSFARSLLIGGLYSSTGIGDVRIEPAEHRDFITIDFYNEDDEEKFLLPRGPLVDFLDQTALRVPFGRESSFVLPGLNKFVDSLYAPHRLPSNK